MANRKGVKVKRRRDVQIKKVKNIYQSIYIHLYAGGALLLVTAYCDSSCNRN